MTGCHKCLAYVYRAAHACSHTNLESLHGFHDAHCLLAAACQAQHETHSSSTCAAQLSSHPGIHVLDVAFRLLSIINVVCMLRGASVSRATRGQTLAAAAASSSRAVQGLHRSSKGQGALRHTE